MPLLKYTLDCRNRKLVHFPKALHPYGTLLAKRSKLARSAARAEDELAKQLEPLRAELIKNRDMETLQAVGDSLRECGSPHARKFYETVYMLKHHYL